MQVQDTCSIVSSICWMVDTFQLLPTLDFQLPPTYSAAGNALSGLLVVAIETQVCLSSEQRPLPVTILKAPPFP